MTLLVICQWVCDLACVHQKTYPEAKLKCYCFSRVCNTDENRSEGKGDPGMEGEGKERSYYGISGHFIGRNRGRIIYPLAPTFCSSKVHPMDGKCYSNFRLHICEY